MTVMSGQNQSSLGVDHEALRLRLKELAPPLADIYAGARELLSSPAMPGLAYFLAHAAREIANGLPEWITGVVSRKESKSLSRLVLRLNELFPEDVRAVSTPAEQEIGGQVLVPRDLIQEIVRILRDKESRATSGDTVRRLFEWLGPGNRYLAAELGPLIKEWMALRRWFESTNHAARSRAAIAPDAADAVAKFGRFERWLEALLKGFFASRRDLDLILDDAGPERLPEILRLLIPDEQRRYFFQRLAQQEDPAWLEPLRDHGFFDGPPAPGWSAAPYLMRMADNPVTQEIVATVLLRMLSTNSVNHWSVQSDFVDITLRLPESSAARLSRKMRRWRGGPTGSVAVKLGTLAVRLARGGQAKDGMALMESLLATRRPAAAGSDEVLLVAEPEPRIGSRGLAGVVDRALPDFISATGLPGLTLVCRSLEKALSKRAEAAESAVDDGSHIWWPRIEDQDVENTFAPKLLAAAVARSALQLAQSGTPTRYLAATLKAHRWEAFQRLAQYLIARSPTDAPEALRAELLDRRQFDLFRREYRMLLEAGFGYLAAPDQDTILDWIETGADRERLRTSFQSWHGREPTVEELEHDWRWLQWHWLGPLTTHLPSTWQGRQHALNNEFGKPPRADESEFRSSFAQIGERAGPVTIEQVRSLPAQEIAGRYRDWQPEREGRPMLPDDGTVLSEGVATDPQRFATAATCFVGGRPTPVRAVFRGLERASREERSFDWDQVLTLAAWALTQRPIEWDHENPFSEEQGWKWTRGAWARLLQAGIARTETAPPKSFSERIWPLIASLKDDPPVNRAEAISAAIQYAYWLKATDGELLSEVPEVASFLEGQLGSSLPGAERVHEEFGEWLAFLAWHAPSWTRANLAKILPLQQDLWEAALKAHLRGRRLSPRVFDVLRDLYVRAVEELQPPEPEKLPGVKTDSTFVQEGLAEHIMALYRWGTLEQTESTQILDTFFANASADLRRYSLNSIGRSLRYESGEPQSVPDAELGRLQQLWMRRTTRLAADPRIREELPAFGSWFASGQFDEEWTLDQMGLVLRDPVLVDGAPILDQDGVMSRLAAMVETYPAQVAQILQQLAQTTEYAYWAYGWGDEIRQILGGAVRSGDSHARRAAVGFIDRLGALGVRNVSELVGASHDLDDPLAIPYFFWDQPMTVVQFRDRLSSASEPERDRLLGLLLREAVDTDVWRFTSPQEVASRWSGIEKHLGRRRNFWGLLLEKWQEQGLLAR